MRAGLVTLLALLAAVPVASAHPLGQQHGGYRATVSNVQPPVLGLQVAVLGGDQRLRISNLTGKTILIVGPEGDPFLRFTTEAVYRFEPVTSRWHQVALGTTYVWAEPRISWTEESPPLRARRTSSASGPSPDAWAGGRSRSEVFSAGLPTRAARRPRPIPPPVAPS